MEAETGTGTGDAEDDGTVLVRLVPLAEAYALLDRAGYGEGTGPYRELDDSVTDGCAYHGDGAACGSPPSVLAAYVSEGGEEVLHLLCHGCAQRIAGGQL